MSNQDGKRCWWKCAHSMTEFPVPARWLVDKNQDIISRSETCLRHTAREPPNLPMTIPLRSACGPIESQVQISFSRRLDKMSCISMTSMVSSQSYSFSVFCYERCFVGKECRAFYILHTFWIQTLRAGTECKPKTRLTRYSDLTHPSRSLRYCSFTRPHLQDIPCYILSCESGNPFFLHADLGMATRCCPREPEADGPQAEWPG